ncbi:hypothetical protein J6590_026921 [Homalodisca vitripennis]|nr:hypothetical protein J6590_026921 [Homalodisca vitripennis]
MFVHWPKLNNDRAARVVTPGVIGPYRTDSANRARNTPNTLQLAVPGTFQPKLSFISIAPNNERDIEGRRRGVPGTVVIPLAWIQSYRGEIVLACTNPVQISQNILKLLKTNVYDLFNVQYPLTAVKTGVKSFNKTNRGYGILVMFVKSTLPARSTQACPSDYLRDNRSPSSSTIAYINQGLGWHCSRTNYSAGYACSLLYTEPEVTKYGRNYLVM